MFSVAVIDSSIIPLPLPGSTDLLLLWLVARDGDPWLLAATAIAGSLLGGYTTWHVGRRGGEATLHRHVPALMLGRITRWVQSHPILAVFLPAVLPPPIPLSPFVLASGALGVTRSRFLAVFGAARCLRYSLIAWLGASYGHAMLRLWPSTIEKWSVPLLWGFCSLLTGAVCLGIWKARRSHRAGIAEPHAARAEPMRSDCN